jgi:4-hydroxybenzoyl-CoA thioesterase
VADTARPTPGPAVGGPVYRSEVLVRFAHCDPAGIVFYPRYLEMFNGLVEDWFLDQLGISFAEIHRGRGWGIPTVRLEVDFVAYSVLGEVLTATLVVRRLGTTSIDLGITLSGPDGADRVRGRVVLVLVDAATRRAVAIPPDLRARLSAFVAPE